MSRKAKVFSYDSLNPINQAYNGGATWSQQFNIDAWGTGGPGFESVIFFPSRNCGCPVLALFVGAPSFRVFGERVGGSVSVP